MPGERLYLTIPLTRRKDGFGKSCEALYENISITHQTGETPLMDRVEEPLLRDDRGSLIAQGKFNILEELGLRSPNPEKAWVGGNPAYQT
ncbi:MAG: hypothetical protein WD970_01940 [Patescibacteria group bacterium]